MKVGGFPEAQGLDGASREQLLREYVDVGISRDVVEPHETSNGTGLCWLVGNLLRDAAGLFRAEKIYPALKSHDVPISKDTVPQLLS